MKKRVVFGFAAMAAALLVSACASAPGVGGGGGGGVPAPLAEARRAALAMEGDMIVGIGTANMPTVARSRSQAANRALLDITRQLGAMVEYMSVDFGMGAETDHAASVEFQREVQRTLARERIQGATTIEEYRARDGQYWVAMRFSRAAATSAMSNAVNEAMMVNAAWAALGVREMQAALDELMPRAAVQNNVRPMEFVDTDRILMMDF